MKRRENCHTIAGRKGNHRVEKTGRDHEIVQFRNIRPKSPGVAGATRPRDAGL